MLKRLITLIQRLMRGEPMREIHLDSSDTRASMESPKDDTRASLESRKGLVERRRVRTRKMFYLYMSTGTCFILWGLFWLIGSASGLLHISRTHAIFYAELALTGVITWFLLPVFRAGTKRAEDEIRDIEFDMDLLRFEATPRQSRAEKLLRINQYQLKLYYDQNLSQGSWIFGLGVASIFFGVGLIVYTLYLVKSFGQNWQDKAVVG